ncbi:hypothetical protein R1sor_021195 [Riccia sorocarpa]|uniref:Kinetochore protein Spc24 n=1 Tax=Riccia sorocarpa TaxID=122646 RepID=A0ABD3GIG8_9MARC
MAEQLKVQWFRDAIDILRNISNFHEPETQCAALVEGREMLTKKMTEWQAKLGELHSRNEEVDDCLEAIEEQLHSIKTQKETLEKPDPDEGFLKNELSLFLNVSSILPDLGDPKFSGTYVDKQKGVKTFKFSADEMTPFEICQAAWDMMK